jgi:hypothetical protein
MRLLVWRVGVLAVAVTMGGGSAVSANEPARTMADLEARVTPGTKIDVVDRKGRIVRGEFARADDEGVLVISYGSGEARRVPAPDVLSVTRPGDSVLNGALIGAAFGALPVIGLKGNLASREAVSIVGTYAAIGALIDLAFKGRTLVYRASGPRVSLSVTPHPVAGGAGVRLAIGFGSPRLPP